MYHKEDYVEKRNYSGAHDPVAFALEKKEVDEERRFKNLLKAIYTICDLSDFHIMEHIVVKDKRTGRIWK